MSSVTDEEWEWYKRFYDKCYWDPEDDEMRRALYTAAKKKIAEHKIEAGEVSLNCKLDINEMSDATPEELSRKELPMKEGTESENSSDVSWTDVPESHSDF